MSTAQPQEQKPNIDVDAPMSALHRHAMFRPGPGPRLSNADLRVLMALSISSMNVTEICNIGNLSDSTARRCLQELECLDLVKGQGRPRVFRLKSPDLLSMLDECAETYQVADRADKQKAQHEAERSLWKVLNQEKVEYEQRTGRKHTSIPGVVSWPRGPRGIRRTK